MSDLNVGQSDLHWLLRLYEPRGLHSSPLLLSSPFYQGIIVPETPSRPLTDQDFALANALTRTVAAS